ncbi:hypothetical protein M3J09_000391 [Ascochyta lentis]
MEVPRCYRLIVSLRTSLSRNCASRKHHSTIIRLHTPLSRPPALNTYHTAFREPRHPAGSNPRDPDRAYLAPDLL